ncbi:hypothetical protein F4604DRAFT_2043226 [Suillus subluteus]|nr:hypothetical protein F4604DRAFT_2043226 [Suillus subluteus]
MIAQVQDIPSGVKQGADPQSVDTALQDALDAADQMNALWGPARSVASAGQYPPETLDDMDNIETTCLQPLRIFDTVIGKVEEVHPYAKMALSVLSCASKFSIGILERDCTTSTAREIGDAHHRSIQDPIIADVQMVDGLLRRRRMTHTYYICQVIDGQPRDTPDIANPASPSPPSDSEDSHQFPPSPPGIHNNQQLPPPVFAVAPSPSQSPEASEKVSSLVV